MTRVEKLRVRSLAKAYGENHALRGVGFHVDAGEVFGLLGPNGAGKTTVLECITGLRQPDAGEILVCGFDPRTQAAEFKRRVGVVLQSTALQERITPREALDLFGAFYRRRADTAGLLARFALVEKADAPFDSLSAGQRQRLALALAFVNEPELVILDEPTAGLDAPSRRELRGLIVRLREEGRAVLLTTHDIEEAQTLCDRVAVLDAGRIVATGTPAELVARLEAPARIVARARHPVAAAEDWVFPGGSAPRVHGDEVSVATGQVGAAVIALVHHLEAHGNELLDLRVETPSLEDALVAFTGGSTR